MGAVSRFKKVFTVGSDIRLKDAVAATERLQMEETWGCHKGGIWSVLVSDILHLPFEDNAFDLVICSEVLEHVRNHEAAISELVRVLKPGKNLAVSVPRCWPERICWAISDEYHTVNNGHLRIYKQKELISLLERVGVQKWGAHFAHGLHTPYWWLKCVVGPARNDSRPVQLYHRFLVWDMMKRPWVTRILDYILTPIMGKSLVLYLRKKELSTH
jgi:SAM-dependent methyltransferase